MSKMSRRQLRASQSFPFEIVADAHRFTAQERTVDEDTPIDIHCTGGT
jgi:hypothetical protein